MIFLCCLQLDVVLWNFRMTPHDNRACLAKIVDLVDLRVIAVRELDQLHGPDDVVDGFEADYDGIPDF